GKAQAYRLKDTIQNKLTCLQFRQFPPLPLPWRAGAAVYSPQQAAHPSEAASWLISKAGRTLNAAWDLDDGNLLFFDELGDKAGRVKEVVSFNRLLINLGHLHGLKENAAFVVMDKDKEKAEISVPRPGGENSLAEVGNLYEPALIIKPGDQLRPLKPEDSWQAGRPGHSATLRLAGREVAVSLDETTPLLNHHSFMTAFRQLTENGEEGARELIPPLAAVLVKVADLGNLRQIAGRPGVDHVFRVLAEKAHAFNSGRDSGIVCARYAPDTVALLLPGYDRDKALNHARDLMGELVPLSERPLRAGVSYYPCLDFAPGQLLDNAAKSLTHAEFMEPGSVVACDAVSLNIYADSLFSEGLLAEAAAEYERALRLNPGELNVLNSLGVCYARLNRAGQAHAMFRRAQQTAPDDYMAYYNEAYDLMARDREGWPEAERLLRHCLSLQPGHPDVLFQLGRVAQNQGQFNQALDYYQQAQASPRCPGGVYRYLGEVLSLSAKLREAEEAFKKAVKFNSADAISLNHLASLYLQRGANLEIALSLAKRAWELDPERPRVWQVYAYALDKLGRSEQARALLQHGLRRYPDDPAQKLLLAQIQIRAGQLAEARDNLRQVLALEPNMKEALEALASLPGE
ncbi:MAG: tetratricopeptide repeat protein, partial [Desulfarculales bacterium]|nr:tetratricopeptide repeat protein [Desulfarculales bacterium]